MALLVRQEQLKILNKIFGCPEQPVTRLPPALLVWGHPQSGKSEVVSKAVDASGVQRRANVHSNEILCGVRPFLQTIIEQLFRDTGDREEFQSKGEVLIDKPNSFVLQIMRRANETEQMIIVVQDAERLISTHQDLLYILVNCRELTQRNVCVILCSTLPFRAYSAVKQMKLMPSIHFPLFNKIELSLILNKEIPPKMLHIAQTYEFIVSTVLDLQYTRCRDLQELRRMIIHLAEQNLRQQARDRSKDLNETTLWNQMKKFTRDSGMRGTKKTEETGPDTNCISLMPKNCKFMLIAAFIASQNPASSDRRFFVQRALRKRKAGGVALGQGDPKSTNGNIFTHTRLLAIFCTLTETKEFPVDTSTNSYITTLCDSKYLRRIEDDLGDCKYRCTANLDFVTSIGDSIGFEVKPYILHLR